MNQHRFFGSTLLICLMIGLLMSCQTNETASEISPSTGKAPKVGISSLNVPIVIPVTEIQQLINNKLPMELVKEQPIKAPIKLVTTVKKAGEVALRMQGDTAYWDLPVRVLVYGKRKEKLDFGLIVYFASSVALDDQWKIITKSRMRGMKWTDKPMLKVGPAEISLAGTLEKALEKRQKELLTDVDKLIRSKVNLKKALNKVWDDLQKPIRVNRKVDTVWLMVRPESIAHSQINSKDQNILVNVRLEAFLNTITGQKPEMPDLKPMPNLTMIEDLDPGFQLNIQGSLAYSDLNRLLRKKVDDLPIKVKDHKVILDEVKVQPDGDDLRVTVWLNGEVEGKLIMIGTPEYDESTASLTFNDLKFDLKSEEWLTDAYTWLFHDSFRKKLSDKLKLELGAKLETLPQLIERAVNRGKTGRNIQINITDFNLEDGEIVVTQNSIDLTAKAQGKTEMQVANLARRSPELAN